MECSSGRVRRQKREQCAVRGYDFDMNVLVLGCSLNPGSNSQILAREAAAIFSALAVRANVIDLREHPLPVCDGETSDANTEAIAAAVRDADAIVFAVPIYNYDVNAAAKNVVEHVGSEFEGKLVAFLCSAGGSASYMSVMSLANSLMLDFRCLIVPRFVYSTSSCFRDGKIVSNDVAQRVRGLCEEVVRLGRAVART
jgi:NAD(P)H-dependent FMN reductase